MSPVQDGPSCPGCGLPNYYGLCGVCRGDEALARAEGLPYPFDERPADGHTKACRKARAKAELLGNPEPECACDPY